MRPTLSLESRYGLDIRTMDEWRDNRKAVNAGSVPGKSAWENANAWVGTGNPLVPAEFLELLESNKSTAGMKVERGVVELQTHLRHRPPFGPRNHDLALWGSVVHRQGDDRGTRRGGDLLRCRAASGRRGLASECVSSERSMVRHRTGGLTVGSFSSHAGITAAVRVGQSLSVGLAERVNELAQFPPATAWFTAAP